MSTTAPDALAAVHIVDGVHFSREVVFFRPADYMPEGLKMCRQDSDWALVAAEQAPNAPDMLIQRRLTRDSFKKILHLHLFLRDPSAERFSRTLLAHPRRARDPRDWTISHYAHTPCSLRSAMLRSDRREGKRTNTAVVTHFFQTYISQKVLPGITAAL